MKHIFVIHRAWADPLENSVSGAFGYQPYGFFDNAKDALEFCQDAGSVGDGFCWAATGREPFYKISTLKNLKDEVGK